jgi:Tfp pilus assembly protein PilV
MVYRTAKQRRMKGRRGYSLIEAMVATMVMSLVLSSALTTSSHSFLYVSDIRLRGHASQALQEQMEKIRLMSWSQVQTLSPTFSVAGDTKGVFSGTVSQTAYDSYSGTTTLVRVTLTITWKNRQGQVMTSKLTTLVGNGGLNRSGF